MPIDFQNIDILDRANLKATKTRSKVLDAIKKNKGAISQNKIQNELNLDRVTLYRTLNSFLENGIIHQAHNDGNQIFYAICSSNCNSHRHQHNHAHLVCKQCSTINCQPLETPFSLNLPSFKVETISITVNGTCADCLEA